MTKPPLPPAPPFSGVLEAALYADDLDAAEAFFGGVLGLNRLIRAGNRHVFFRVGATTLLVFNPAETCKPPSNPDLPVPAHGSTGQGHVCFAATDNEITAWRARLTAAGHAIEADFRWPGGARSLYFRDPAGNSIEIAEPRLWDIAG
ncbi:VOC family protein [Actibacterium sp. D379-3]